MANNLRNLETVPTAEQRLEVICSDEYLLQHTGNQKYSNEDIVQVAALLNIANYRSWATHPRLYILLRRTGLFPLGNLFFSTHHTDAHFPYSTFTLPNGMEVKQRSLFLKAQACVLTGISRVSRWELGEHMQFSSSKQVPLEPKAILGTGGSAQVEVVTLRAPAHVAHEAFSKQLVRKLIRRRVLGRLQGGLEIFRNELSILKRLQHRHLVEIIGSYTDPSYAALIMSPVADWDLADFLRIAATDNQKLSSIRTFFGCLATALAYLHGMRIRHKDIKPSNILVHQTNVLFTDFGLSRDCNGTRSTTEGPTAKTIKYAAPEVADYGPRNSSSDIWSLGCVYLEMMTVMSGMSLEQLSAFMLENGTGLASYHANVDAVDLWMLKIRNAQVGKSEIVIIDWIQAMQARDRIIRPSAEVLAAEIATSGSGLGRVGEFCGICCRREDEQYIDVEMEDDSPIITGSSMFEYEVSDTKAIQSTENVYNSSDITSYLEDSGFVRSQGESRFTIASSSEQREMQTTATLTPDSEISEPLTRSQRDPGLPRFFILRANSGLDIETSAAFQSWTCGKNTNVRLDKVFRDTKADIYLIFSVVGSRKFCGVARMATAYDPTTTLPHWQTVGWQGNIEVDWKSFMEVNYDDVQHLRRKEGGEGSHISRVMSGMEICYSSGMEMMNKLQVEGF